MKRYSVGFVLNGDGSKVILVTKNHPDWQKGLLNGPGGHVLDNETFLQAVVREVFEETGVETQEAYWQLMAETVKMGQYSIQFFRAFVKDFEPKSFVSSDEPAAWYEVNNLPPHTLYNVRWMLQMFNDTMLQFPVLLYNR
jgi:8-oxo-dGTP diphosphatase